MDWSQVIAIFAVIATNLTTVIVLFCHMDNKTDKLICAIRDDIKSFQMAMANESRDFHGRLCSIEERYKNKDSK